MLRLDSFEFQFYQKLCGIRSERPRNVKCEPLACGIGMLHSLQQIGAGDGWGILFRSSALGHLLDTSRLAGTFNKHVSTSIRVLIRAYMETGQHQMSYLSISTIPIWIKWLIFRPRVLVHMQHNPASNYSQRSC